MNCYPGDTPIITPPLKPDGKLKQIIQVRKDKTLFRSSDLDDQAKRFELVDENPSDADTVFMMSTPGLKALKNQKLIDKLKNKPTTIRPFTSSKYYDTSSHKTSYISPIKKKPLPNLASITKMIEEGMDEGERMSLNFTEDPVSYFSKHKDGDGHHFIYLIHTRPHTDPYFNPYDIVKSTHTELKSEYFTMSANGVTHVIGNGETETLTLDRWCFESAMFSAIRKLNVFKLFRFWRNFQLWRRFLQRTRFESIKSKVVSLCLFKQPLYYVTLFDILKESCVGILTEHLLCFYPQRRQTVQQFQDAISKNTELLEEKFQNFFSFALKSLLMLDGDIRDPEKVTVKVHDIDKRRNFTPTMSQMLEIKLKIDKEVSRRTKIVNDEILTFGQFVRFMDYFILESVEKECHNCWKTALGNLSQPMSSIFQIELSFAEDGTIKFTPSIDELLKAFEESFENSFITLDKLPRILLSPQLRPHLRELIDSVENLFTLGPSFGDFARVNKDYHIIREKIIEILKESFANAKKHSEGFTQFFGLYKLGQTWEPSQYVKPKSGFSRDFDLLQFSKEFEREFSGLCYNPAKELRVDFDKLVKDIEYFKKEEKNISDFQVATVQGAIYIESKKLRHILMPIPVRSLQSIALTLKNLLNDKIDRMSSILQFCSKRLKKEPNDLVQYVDNIEFSLLAKDLTPHLLDEIEFIDELSSMVDNMGYSTNFGSNSRNPLKPLFQKFLTEQQTCQTIQESHTDSFNVDLQTQIDDVIKEINKYRAQLDSAPKVYNDLDVGALIQQTNSLAEKIAAEKPNIERLQRCQRVMGQNINDFSIYEKTKTDIDMLLSVYDIAKDWGEISEKSANESFINMDVMGFIDKVNHTSQKIAQLETERKCDIELLLDVSSKIRVISSCLDSIEMLHKGEMHNHHWNKLFEECCESKSYHEQIKIDELLDYGVLAEKEKIRAITTISKGEAQLESEFKLLLSKWKEVRLPILYSNVRAEDSLLLENSDKLLLEIDDAQIEIQRMIRSPFVQRLKQQVINMESTLRGFTSLLKSWQEFQSMWIVLSVFFASDETRQSMPQLVEIFNNVRRRWIIIVKHTLENTRLWYVSEFPSIIEIMRENSSMLSHVFQMTHKYLDSKRHCFPRLFFLSNDDVMTLFSTVEFETFNHIISKIFVRVKELESHTLEQMDSEMSKNTIFQNFSGIKISGIKGWNGDVLTLNKAVSCAGSLETWCPQLITTMKHTVQNQLDEALKKYRTFPPIEFFQTATIHLITLVLHIHFAREIQECFNNFENNIRTFSDYAKLIQTQIINLAKMLQHNLSPSVRNRIICVLTFYNYCYEFTNSLTKMTAGPEKNMVWFNFPKLQYNSKENIKLTIGDDSLDFDYEYFGEIYPIIIGPTVTSVLQNVSYMLTKNFTPIVHGSHGLGKKNLIYYLSSICARFIFFSPSFNEPDSVTLLRVISGAIATGSWVCISNVESSNVKTQLLIADVVNTLKYHVPNRNEVQFGLFKVNIVDTFRIILTSSSFGGEHKITESLKNHLMPVALNTPNIYFIINTKLMVEGYFNHEELTGRFITMVEKIVGIFDEVPGKQSLSRMLDIITSSTKINSESIDLRQRLALATYSYFNHIISDAKRTIFTQIIGEFCNDVDFANCLHNERIDMIVNKLASYESDVDKYIAGRASMLFEQIINHRLVFIYGPSKSGKTSALNFLTKAIAEVKGELPIKVFDLFHHSNTGDVIFGDMKYQDDGPVFVNGTVHNLLKTIKRFVSTHWCILRFIGPATNELLSFLQGMISSTPYVNIVFNTLDHLPDNCSVIVETEKLEGITPSLVSYSGFLSTELIYNFSSLFSAMESNLPKISYSQELKSHFESSLPHFIERCNQLKTIYSDPQTKKEMLESILPRHSIQIGFIYGSMSGVTEEHLRQIAVHTLFLVYSSILSQELVNEFDTWTRKQFDITLPYDWVKYNPPKCFMEEFPLPNLASTYFGNGEFNPVLTTLLLEPPVVKKQIRQHIPSVYDLKVMHPQILLPLFISQMAFQSKLPFILSGPSNCGKSTILEYLFRDDSSNVILTIDVSSFSTGDTLSNEIQLQLTNYEKDHKNESCANSIIVIFNNVTSSNMIATEFIISIMSSTTSYDPYNFYIIVTTDSLTGFEPRFLTNFLPISLKETSKPTKAWVFTQVSQFYKVNESLSRDMMNLVLDLCGKYNDIYYLDLLNAIILSPLKENAISASNLPTLKMFLSELRFLYAHRLSEDDLMLLSSKFNSMFSDTTIQSAYEPIINGEEIFLPTLKEDVDGSYITSFDTQRHNLIREELEFMLKTLKTRPDLKALMKFYNSTIDNWIFLERALLLPGKNLCIKGIDGSGREALCCLYACIKEHSYMYITDDYTIDMFKSTLSELIKQALIKKKKVIVFTSIESLSHDIQNLIEHITRYGDISLLYTQESYSEIMRIFSTHVPDDISSNSLLSELRGYVMECVKFIFSCSNDFVVYPNFITVIFSKYSPESVFSTITNALDHYKNEKLINVFRETCVYVSSFSCFAHLVDFIDIFKMLYDQQLDNFNDLLQKSAHSVSFIKNIDSKMKSIQDDIKLYEPQVKGDMESKNTLDNDIKSRLDMVNDRIKRLDTTEKKLREDVEKAEKEEKQVANEVNELQTALSISINAMQKPPLADLKLLFNNNSFTKSIELLCICCGEPPKFDPVGMKMIHEGIVAKLQSQNLDELQIDDSLESEVHTRINAINIEEIDTSFAKSIVEAVLDMSKLGMLRNNLHKKVHLREDAMEKLDKFIQDSDFERDSIKTIQESLKQQENERGDITNSGTDVLEMYEGAVTKKKQLEELYKDINFLEKRWTDYNASADEIKEKMMGDCLICAFFMVYGGADCAHVEKLCNILERNDVGKSEGSPLEIICQMLTMLETGIDNIKVNSFEAKVHCMALEYVRKTPFIIDPDGYLLNYISSTVSTSELKICSVLSYNLEGVVIEAMETGKLLILTDVYEISPIISSILDVPAYCNDNICITFGDKQVIPKSTFKLYLFSSLFNVPYSISSRTTVIDFFRNYQSISRDQIEKLFITTNQPKLLSHVNDERVLRVERNVKIARADKELIEIMSDIYETQQENEDYIFTDDQDVFELLLGAKSTLFENINHTVNEEDRAKSQECLSIYKKSVDLAYAIWFSLSRKLSLVSEFYMFNINDFISSLKHTLEISGVDYETEFNEEVVRTNLIENTLKSYLDKLNIRDSLVLMFLVSFYEKAANNNVSENDMNEIIEHLRKEQYSICDHKIDDKIIADCIEQLKFTNVQYVFQLITQQVSELIGPKFDSLIPVNRLPDTGYPLVINCEEGNPAGLFDQNTMVICVIEGEKFRKMFFDHVKLLKDDSTLVLVYEKPDVEIGHFLNYIVQEYINQKPKYKLVCILRTSKYISRYLLSSSTVVIWKYFPGFRQSFTQIKPDTTFPGDIYRYTYAISMLYASSKYRQVISGIGLSDVSCLDDSIFRHVIHRVTQTTCDLCVLGVFHLFESAVRSSFEDRNDINIVLEHAKRIFVPQLTSDQMTFTCPSSTENDKWFIPAESDIENYINSMEVFPFTDQLMIDQISGRVFRNWSLSRWLITSLTRLRPVNHADIDAKISSLIVMLPKPISHVPTISSISDIFLDKEIKTLNAVLYAIQNDIYQKNIEVLSCIAHDATPKTWLEILCFAPQKIFKFFNNISRKAKLIEHMIEHGLPNPIDISLISHPFYFFQSQSPGSHPIFLELSTTGATGSALIGLSYDNGSYMMPEKTGKSFSAMPTISICSLEHPEECKHIPVYNLLPSDSSNEYIDGTPKNQIGYLIIKECDASQGDLIINGCCCVLHPPEAFTEQPNI